MKKQYLDYEGLKYFNSILRCYIDDKILESENNLNVINTSFELRISNLENKRITVESNTIASVSPEPYKLKIEVNYDNSTIKLNNENELYAVDLWIKYSLTNDMNTTIEKGIYNANTSFRNSPDENYDYTLIVLPSAIDASVVLLCFDDEHGTPWYRIIRDLDNPDHPTYSNWTKISNEGILNQLNYIQQEITDILNIINNPEPVNPEPVSPEPTDDIFSPNNDDIINRIQEIYNFFEGVSEGSKFLDLINQLEPYVLPLASSEERGGIKIGFNTSDKDKYAVKLDDERAYVEIANLTDTINFIETHKSEFSIIPEISVKGVGKEWYGDLVNPNITVLLTPNKQEINWQVSLNDQVITSTINPDILYFDSFTMGSEPVEVTVTEGSVIQKVYYTPVYKIFAGFTTENINNNFSTSSLKLVNFDKSEEINRTYTDTSTVDNSKFVVLIPTEYGELTTWNVVFPKPSDRMINPYTNTYVYPEEYITEYPVAMEKLSNSYTFQDLPGSYTAYISLNRYDQNTTLKITANG